MRPKQILLLMGALFCISLSVNASDGADDFTRTKTTTPMAFTKNMGQWPDSILFRAETNGAVMWLVRDGIYYQFTGNGVQTENYSGTEGRANLASSSESGTFTSYDDSIFRAMIKAEFVGTDLHAEIVLGNELQYRSNYFLGNDSTKWRINVPSYNSFTIKGMYPGVAVSYREEGGKLLCEQSAATKDQLSKVLLRFRGPAASVELVNRTMVVQSIVTSDFIGDASFDQASSAGPLSLSSSLNPSTLGLVYSTYLGGSDEDSGSKIVADSSGCLYVIGSTLSQSFPTMVGYDTLHNGLKDVFVTKLSAAGNVPIYSTFIGGAGYDYGYDIDLDEAGRVYVAGSTGSSDFPVLNAFDASYSGLDAFVAKLSANGSVLIYSTFLGGTGDDRAYGIEVDRSGACYVTGQTSSTNFPVQSSFDPNSNGVIDAFVTKLSSSGNVLVYSTYLGGNRDDYGLGIALDSAGYAYVAGETYSSDFPMQNAFDSERSGLNDAFVTKLSPSGNTIVYSSFIGGSSFDSGHDIAVDGHGGAYVVGETYSTDFPTLNAYDSVLDMIWGDRDAFVLKVTPSGNAIEYSSFLGGGDNDGGNSVVVDTAACAHVSGYTESADFPSLNGYDANHGGGTFDAFLTKFAPTGKLIIYSSYLGGSQDDHSSGVALDRNGNVYLTGTTSSVDFPTQSALDLNLGGVMDGFVTKLTWLTSCCIGVTGNLDNSPSDAPDLTDLSLLIGYLTLQPKPNLNCLNEANVNGQGSIDLSDLSYLIGYLTLTPRPVLPICQ